jgi:methionyl-tRNA formyltransferase
MKIAFCTCVQLGKSCIEKVYSLGGNFDLLITLEDHLLKKKSGRIYLDSISDKHSTPLLKINHINDNEVIKSLKKYEIDWLFIIGWSQIASEDVLKSCKKGVIGAHPTLLPKGRGRAAIPWAIIKGLDSTGLTFFKMDKGVDTGDILQQIEIPITKDETSNTLYDKVNTAHIDLIEKIWPQILSHSLISQKQDESQATYWDGRKPQDGEIDLKNMTVDKVDRLVRATTKPYPGAFIINNNQKIIIWSGVKNKDTEGMKIECKDGIFIAKDIEVLNL